jgi:hypothetical protein
MSILEKKGKKFSFSNDSESIVKSLINKFISLSITKSFTSKVEDQISNYCYEKLKQILKSYCEIRYISYERDDGPIQKETNIQPPKSVNNDLEISKLSEFKISQLDQSNNVINRTQIDKKINECLLNFSKDNILEKQKIPFDVNNIENIEKIEISSVNQSKIEENNFLNFEEEDNSLFYDNYNEEKNFWGTIPQPKPISIDRNASTMIKFSKDIIIDTDRLSNSNKESKTNRTLINTFRKKTKKKKEEEDVEEKNKKKIVLPIEAHDIPIEQFPNLIEGNEINILREEKENEIKLKKLEELRRIQKEEERLQKEKEKKDKYKDNALKEITVDPNGNIIHIRPLNIDQLINEFTSANSIQKYINQIEGEVPKFQRKSIIVEKNPNKSGLIVDMGNTKNSKDNKNKKGDLIYKKKHTQIKSSDNINNENNNNEGINNLNNKDNLIGNKNLNDNNSLPSINSPFSILKKSNSQFAAGSNFDLMQLEIGVDLKENSKFKTGGKDFFKKFNKYSVENFEQQQNKTQTENFYKTRNESLENIKRYSIYNKTDEHRNDNENLHRDYHKTNFLNLEPSEMNNTLHLKTKNLKIALSELDLITETTIKDNKYYSKNKPGDLFHKKKLVNMKNYDAMNKFAKTLMGSSSWGILNKKNTSSNKGIIIPKITNVNDSKLRNTRSRKKILPLSNNNINANIKYNNNKMSITTTTGFYQGNSKKRFKLPKLKEQDFIDVIEKDDENDKKGYITTNNFYK